MNNHIELEAGGFVRLDAVMADDLSVVNSARVSFGKRSSEMTKADEGLIRFLMRERHGTPFEHNSFRFHIRVPIFVAREWMRHRIGWSYNEFSARYSEMSESFYVPATENVRSQVGKPGSYTFEAMPPEIADDIADTIRESSSHSFRTYQWLIANGCAKELARSVLPVGMFTEFYATTNARALMHFCSLRSAPQAQFEIRQASLALEELLAEYMPVTYVSFFENGKVAP
jgi:thymidylate synthase (FAD)